MGTRSIITVYDESGDRILTMYGQFDGYPHGVGLEIATFINSKLMVNGYTPKQHDENSVFNGMGCLAASLVCHLKQGKVGGFYLYPQTDHHDAGQKYEYIISPGSVAVRDVIAQKEIFNGTWQAFEAFCKEALRVRY